MILIHPTKQKWYVAEADKRIPEIQGILELSVQRSSCERDPNKDRLYVYMKRDCFTPLSTSTDGIFSTIVRYPLKQS